MGVGAKYHPLLRPATHNVAGVELVFKYHNQRLVIGTAF